MKVHGVAVLFLLGGVAAAQPSPAEIAKRYDRADRIRGEFAAKAFHLSLEPNWLDEGKRFWYRRDLPSNRREFVLVDSATGAKSAPFDAARLAESLKKEGIETAADRLPFRTFEFVDDGKAIQFEFANRAFRADLSTYALTKQDPRPTRPAPPRSPWRQNLWVPDKREVRAPEGGAIAQVTDAGIRVTKPDGSFVDAGATGEGDAYFARVTWTPDSKYVIAARVNKGDRKQVHLLESSPTPWGPAILESRAYDRPGDKVDTFDLFRFDVATGKFEPLSAPRTEYGGMPNLRWRKDRTKFTYELMDRGYGRWRLIEVDPAANSHRTIIDDDPATFFDSTAAFEWYARESDEIIFRSERTGWGHLYLVDADGGMKPITSGNWVVRGVEWVDEAKREIVFRASGVNPGEDPYFIHYYRIKFDGTGFTRLTQGTGNHSVQFSPNREFYVDTYSTVENPPVHELRRISDGGLVARLESANIEELRKAGWRAPRPFVAKGRDGKTDIYGHIYLPTDFRKGRKYPVLEDIYAGPHDSFVPKSFSPMHGSQNLAEIGFIVVRIDGMGTRNRGKAFHDVAYKNLGDAGFPDRIAWMKAVAKQVPEMDLDRVGVFGTSAGGQSSTGALLFHPDFYKVAVSSCGCHDNRLDKIWWNEQWMGYPVGPEYARASNIDNAAKLRGRLMLLVGELDDNVPPESTLRLADALMKANREFELVFLTGQGHTAGGRFGERKRRDFFVRHLLGAEPPAWNERPN